MRNRDMQKAMRKARHAGLIPPRDTKKPQVGGKPWLNPEGYHDPTAYQALRNVECQEEKKYQEIARQFLQ